MHIDVCVRKEYQSEIQRLLQLNMTALTVQWRLGIWKLT